jgi:hypothetical protein
MSQYLVPGPALGVNVPTEHLDWPFLQPFPPEWDDDEPCGGMTVWATEMMMYG